MQTTVNGRAYTLTAKTPSQPVQDHLIGNGWDGITYFGESQPTGRQRKIMTALFYREAKTGEFALVVRF
jgi:hypothetical protein